ncbi:MAG TPA: hypothetical protein VG055_02800 [Planctomycetaceae bacterium]|jgi:hypothetical protein|nr:hypothetical protein [Planctomycetaceae bacterium]
MRTIETRDEAERPVAPQRRRGRSDGSSLRDRVVIISTVLGVIAFVLIGLPYLKRDLPAEGLPVVATDVAPDSDRHAVREWLRSNDHDPHPREIRWWPARTLDELYRRQLTAAKDAVEDSEDDDPQLRDYVEQLEHDGPERVCRLKFRSKNEVGAQISHDDLFVLRGGRVRPVRNDTSVATAMRKYFPDDAGEP